MPKVLTKVRAAVPVFIGGATGGAMTAILLPALGPFACVVSILTGAAVGVGVEKILPRRSQ